MNTWIGFGGKKMDHFKENHEAKNQKMSSLVCTKKFVSSISGFVIIQE